MRPFRWPTPGPPRPATNRPRHCSSPALPVRAPCSRAGAPAAVRPRAPARPDASETNEVPPSLMPTGGGADDRLVRLGRSRRRLRGHRRTADRPRRRQGRALPARDGPAACRDHRGSRDQRRPACAWTTKPLARSWPVAVVANQELRNRRQMLRRRHVLRPMDVRPVRRVARGRPARPGLRGRGRRLHRQHPASPDGPLPAASKPAVEYAFEEKGTDHASSHVDPARRNRRDRTRSPRSRARQAGRVGAVRHQGRRARSGRSRTAAPLEGGGRSGG